MQKQMQDLTLGNWRRKKGRISTYTHLFQNFIFSMYLSVFCHQVDWIFSERLYFQRWSLVGISRFQQVVILEMNTEFLFKCVLLW
jgi:hypothetical protein